MITKPTPEDRKLVAQRVTDALALENLEPTKTFAAQFRRLGKKITFGRSSQPSGLMTLVVTLCVYDKVDNALPQAKNLSLSIQTLGTLTTNTFVVASI